VKDLPEGNPQEWEHGTDALGNPRPSAGMFKMRIICIARKLNARRHRAGAAAARRLPRGTAANAGGRPASDPKEEP
jgi:hypothetical protein